MNKKKYEFFQLLKATRVKRTLPILVLILIPAAIVNRFSLNIFLLGILITMIYGSASIYNAYKDKDYELPFYFPIVLIICFLLIIMLSFSNKILFFSAFSLIILGFIYNTISRYILLSDSFIIGLTHTAIPIITSCLLLGINLKETFSIGIIVYFIGFFMTPVSRLKDMKEDKQRGYRTIINIVQKPKIVAIYSFVITFIFFIFLFLYLNTKWYFLFLLVPLFLIVILLIYQILKEKYSKALDLLRIYLISGYLFLILNLTSNIIIILLSFFIGFFYLFILFKEI